MTASAPFPGSDTATPGPELSARVLAFCAHLRRLGFAVGPAEAGDALAALASCELSSYARFRDALMVVLCSRREQSERFDALVRAFFFPASRGAMPPPERVPGRVDAPPAPPGSGPEASARGSAPRPDADAPDEGVAAGRIVDVAADEEDDAAAEGAAGLALQAAFGMLGRGRAAPPEIPEEDMDAMLDAAGRLLARLERGRSRRWRAAASGSRVHMRRTLRRAVQTGGEALRPAYRARLPRTPRFVLILDGSRSMARDAGVLLQFAHALARRSRRVEVFLFSTGLARVTAPFRAARRSGGVPRLDAMLEAGELDDAWGGGTRIGGALFDFARRYGRRALGRDAVVMIASDGLDTGSPELVARAMREIRRRSAAVVWLNPLLDTPGYEPLAGGMKAALPFVDTFAAAGTAAAFRDLAERVRLVR